MKLMRPDSLAGWDHSATLPSGWTMKEGRLHGAKGASPLLSGFSAGPVELRFEWSVGPGGVLAVDLPEVPRGPGFRLLFREDGPCGTLTDGKKTLHPGVKIAPATGKSIHTATIRRANDTLSVAVDGRKLYAVDLPDARRFGLGLAVVEGEATVADLRGAEPTGVPVFNEKDLSQWWTTGNKKAWRVEQGELVLKPGGGQFLRTKKEYENFTLSFEYKVRSRGNSGMAIRTPRDGWPSGDGMELQILDRPWVNNRPDEHSQMTIYGNVLPLGRADKPGQWNRVVIKADGWMVSAWVNGELVQQYNTLHHPELKHRGRRGWIGPQDHGAWVRMRNLRILEAPPGTGLDAWLTPKPPEAATLVVDRLMNSETLSRDDGVQSTVLNWTIGDKPAGETMVADLVGPGAVIRLAYVGGGEKIAFYFDGEKRPRIECPPGELWCHVTPLCDDRSPVLTYLPYKKSLRIVLHGAKRGRWRIDALRFPMDLPVTTFTDPWTCLPRGWRGPARYRQQVVRWGVHREHDPALRVCPAAKTLAPGKTEVLAQVDGAGLVRWVKLRADQKVLENKDLWLSTTVDGQSEPAVSAPARFWFPGLAQGRNYFNFVLIQRNGLANLLAMPFGRGIVISATNRGDRPIENVSVELSVEQVAEKNTAENRTEIAARARLRGVFLPASEDTDTLFHLEGPGRWVGLVLESPESGLPGIQRLQIDAKAALGWKDPRMATFLGRSGKDYRRCLSGNRNGLAWRYLCLAPVDFQKSLELVADRKTLPDRLVFYYEQPQSQAEQESDSP
ncbi:MAG: DUF1080 domain-containing protein [Pirellulales bacterium]|nr:DUF1080 domain-containing protein [Pirellulales bacterium]